MNNFSQKVYEVVKKVPAGKVLTYKQVAKLSGNEKAYRAVGNILNKNSNPETVPCHRVVASDGSLSGYAFGGIKKKRQILIKEGVRFKNNKVDLSQNNY